LKDLQVYKNLALSLHARGPAIPGTFTPLLIGCNKTHYIKQHEHYHCPTVILITGGCLHAEENPYSLARLSPYMGRVHTAVNQICYKENDNFSPE